MAALLLSASAAIAQHSATLSWTQSTDPVTGNNVYRASGACPTSVSDNPLTTDFTKIATLTTPAVTYVDSTVTVGTWCYFVTAVNTADTPSESIPSNTQNPSVLLFPVSGLTVKVQ